MKSTLSVVRVFGTTGWVMGRLWLIGLVKSGSLQPVLQAAISNGLSLDPFSFGQDGWAASEVDVGRGEIVDALVSDYEGTFAAMRRDDQDAPKAAVLPRLRPKRPAPK